MVDSVSSAEWAVRKPAVPLRRHKTHHQTHTTHHAQKLRRARLWQYPAAAQRICNDDGDGEDIFHENPQLHALLLRHLREATRDDSLLHPSLFPVLLLLSKLSPGANASACAGVRCTCSSACGSWLRALVSPVRQLVHALAKAQRAHGEGGESGAVWCKRRRVTDGLMSDI